MIFLIALIVLILWIWVSLLVAGKLIKQSSKFRGLKVVLLGSAVAILPFAEELYVRGSFRAYCEVYAGPTVLSPIQAAYVEVKGDWNPLAVLENDSVKGVRWNYKTRNIVIDKSNWLTKIKSDECQYPVHQEFLNSTMSALREFPGKIAASGYCYKLIPAANEVAVSLTSSAISKHNSNSIFMTTEMEEVRYWVSAGNPSKVLLEYVVLYANPGFIRRWLSGLFTPYSCPAWGLPGDLLSYPFRHAKYVFLNEAISSGGD